MKVKLARNWFGPDATLYVNGPMGYAEISEEFRELLSPSAKVLDDNYIEPPAKDIDPKTLSEMARVPVSGPFAGKKK